MRPRGHPSIRGSAATQDEAERQAARNGEGRFTAEPGPRSPLRLENQPPLPPLDRGARKSKTPSARRRRIAFSYPPEKGLLKKSTEAGNGFPVGAVRERPLPEKRALHEAPLRHPSGETTTPVIPAKAGIHFRLCLWLFARTLSLPTEEDTDAAIYIRLIRSGFGRGAPSRESEPNAKTKAKIIKWIPAFAGMTSKIPSREIALFPVATIPPASGFFNDPETGG